MLSQDGDEILWKPLDNDGAGTARRKKQIHPRICVNLNQ